MDYDEDPYAAERKNKPKLIPRTPQPRKRKVSVYDLVKALEKALEVENRRPRIEPLPSKAKVPEKMIDITEVIKDVYHRVQTHYGSVDNNKKSDVVHKLTFSELIPSDTKEDKVYTFIPLLHLENQEKVGMDQPEHFGEINIALMKTGFK